MINYPDIRPYIVKIGNVEIRWYGLMYLLGFVASYALVSYQIKKKRLNISAIDVENIYLYIILGLIVGARLGYIIFYNLPYYLSNPMELLAVWHGGMSFHGGLIGAALGGMYYCVKHGLDALEVSDLVVATAPIGLGLGRVGNFINGELFGRPTDVPWAMVFPSGGSIARHPSQIYEFLMEGVLLFAILWFVKGRIKVKGGLLMLFLGLYGTFRLTAEFFREPDPQVGFLFGLFTMGQLLSSFMIAAAFVGYKLISRPKTKT